MVNLIVWMLGLLLYAVFEGITEALTWERTHKVAREDAENAYLISKFIDQGKYHFYRVFEVLGIVIMMLWLYARKPSFSELIFLGVGSLLFAFLVFRIAFVTVREQTTLSPEWSWKVWLPILDKEIIIEYPPAWSIWLAGIIGFLLIIFNFWRL